MRNSLKLGFIFALGTTAIFAGCSSDTGTPAGGAGTSAGGSTAGNAGSATAGASHAGAGGTATAGSGGAKAGSGGNADVAGTSGDMAGAAGETTSAGGATAGSGGANAGAGGANAGAGGATAGSGGANAGAGGATAGAGGANAGAGGATAGSGGANAGAGGATAGSGGANAGAGGATAGSGGATAGAGGATAGAGGATAGAGGATCTAETDNGGAGGGAAKSIFVIDNVVVTNLVPANSQAWPFPDATTIVDEVGSTADKWSRSPYDSFMTSGASSNTLPSCDSATANATGSMKNLIPFSAADQYYEVRAIFAEHNYSIATVSAKVKLVTDAWPGTLCSRAQIYAVTGPDTVPSTPGYGNYAQTTGPFTTLTKGDWTTITMTAPATGFLNVVNLGVRIKVFPTCP